MTSRGVRWTIQQDEMLKKLYESELSMSQIAAKMDCGFTKNSIIGRVHRLKLPLRGHPKAAEQKKRLARTPVIRLVRANSNSTQLRAYEAVQIKQAPLRCAEIEPRNLSLAELEADDCRYPYGDSPFQFCGHPKADGCTYCWQHHLLTRKLSRTIDEAVTEARRRRMRGFNFRRALLEAAP